MNFKYYWIKVRQQVVEVDYIPFAKPVVSTVAEVAGVVVPAVTPFMSGLKEIISKLEDVDDRKVWFRNFPFVPYINKVPQTDAGDIKERLQAIIKMATGLNSILGDSNTMKEYVDKYTQ